MDAMAEWQQLSHVYPITAIVMLIVGVTVWGTLKVIKFVLDYFNK